MCPPLQKAIFFCSVGGVPEDETCGQIPRTIRFLVSTDRFVTKYHAECKAKLHSWNTDAPPPMSSASPQAVAPRLFG